MTVPIWMISTVRTSINALLRHRVIHRTRTLDRCTRRLYPEPPRETRTPNNGYYENGDRCSPSPCCCCLYHQTTGRRGDGLYGGARKRNGEDVPRAGVAQVPVELCGWFGGKRWC